MRDALNALIGCGLATGAWLFVASRSGPHRNDNDRAGAVILAGVAASAAFLLWIRFSPL